MTDIQKKFVPTDEELFQHVAASLRLEGFDTTPKRLRELVKEVREAQDDDVQQSA